MPIYFETASHILLFLTKSGMMIRAGIDCRTVILRLAYMIELRNTRYSELTHAASAIWIMDDLVRLKYVDIDAKGRPRLLAILGTGIGNIPARARGLYA
ncbi:MAG: hypothetical protein ABL901_03830 [Hyphomicrobiaceae bacterium]